MSAITVLLYKERLNYQWSYIIDRVRYTVMTPPCSLLEQLVHLLTDLRDKHDLYDEDVTVCSTTLLRSVVYDLSVSFPSFRFVPITDSDVAKVFKRVASRASTSVIRKNNTKNKTLFVCSDASKSASTDMCGWAWFSTMDGQKGYNFGVSEHRSTVSAEMEGILRAIVDNAWTEHTTIHVYCDSQRSVEWAQSVLYRKQFNSNGSAATGRLLRLIHEARKVATEKTIRVEWVRGHRNHRLNMAADFLSREARLAANRQSRLRKGDHAIEAVLTFIDQ